MFETLQALPPDPILGLSAAYQQDTNPQKVDLGVGVYKDEAGLTQVLKSVKLAEKRRFQQEDSKAYLPPPGSPGANEGLERLIFGEDHPTILANRVRTLQTPGGCGALRVAAELAVRAAPEASIWLSDPTWANHTPLLASAGLRIRQYPYYDYDNHELRFDAMMETLAQVKAGDLVLLHGCCHNPCGADLDQDQWQALAALASRNGFTPFIDLAYQGFGSSLDEDAYGVRLLAESVPEMLVASSCSKNFGLYRERTGALSIVCANPEQADISFSQALFTTRGIYSMPPAHGSMIVEGILHDVELTLLWRRELNAMRDRINGLRTLLTDKLAEHGASRDFNFIKRQRGMFSFLGISEAQVKQLQQQYSIYMVGSSRINIAGINQGNIDYLANAITQIL